MFSGIRRWDLIAMFLLLALVFIFEMLGVFSPKMITITQIIKDFIPMPIRIMVCSWITWHFVVSDLVRQMTPRR